MTVGDWLGLSNDSITPTSRIFDVPGFNQISYKVTDINGCTDSISKEIEIFHNPTVDVNDVTVCQGDSTLFNTSGTIIGSAPFKNQGFEWILDDGNIISMNEVIEYVHLYDTCNIYNVILTATDTNDCFDKDTIITTVNCNPIADFDFVSECEGDTTFFNNTSDVNTTIQSGHSIIENQWNFGVTPSIPSQVPSPTYIYEDAGLYYITLSITDNQTPACSNTLIDSIEIFSSPDVLIISSEVCQGTPTQFEYNSSHSINSWEWGIDTTSGDYIGSDANTPNPVFEFDSCNATGDIVTLSIIDTNECKNNTQGVISFVGPKGKSPIPLRDKEVKRIFGEVERKEGREVLVTPFKKDDHVKIISGPFIDFSGVVEELNDDKQKVKVVISIFGRPTPVELDYFQVEMEK